MSIQRFCYGKKFDFEKSYLLHHYIENIALKYSKNSAVTYDNHTIDYKTLNETANQVAHYLMTEERVIPGDLVGVYFTPSIDLIVSILAIIKAGATYVPLDLTYSKEHVAFIINESNPRVILTNTEYHCTNRKVIDIQKSHIKNYPINNPLILLTPESPAYVIYTSGSTGNPKGVVIPHTAAINHMLWMITEFQFTPSDKILLKTPLTFDPSIWEIFAPLFAGAELVIAPIGSHVDTQLLLNSIITHQITTIQFVPLILQTFLTHAKTEECLSLKRVFVGGESLSSRTKKLFFSKLNCSFINLYGPTETTIDIIYHIVKNTPEELEGNYIGKPIYNTELYILNEMMEPCSIDEPGELYVGGECLGLGYLNREDITRNSFIQNPFFPNKKMYKTGDFVRWAKNGLIEYIGRRDKQLKINGLRVELDALISKIMEQKNVANCFISKNKEGMCTYLICYIMPENRKDIDITTIKKNLNDFFPKAFIPKEFYLIEKFPTLPNGKIDTKSLIKMGESLKKIKNESSNTENNIDEDLLNICKHFMSNDSLDINDNLHENGLDSLLCLLLIQNIEKKYRIDLMIHEVLSSKTISSLGDLISKKLQNIDFKAESSNTIIALKTTGHKTPIFLIHPIGGTVFWYTHLVKYLDPDRPLYGIQDPGIESENYFFDSLEEMADFYFTQIKKIQPSGPYIIGGASFGATVAIEICSHLNEDEVIAIPVLDGWAVYPDNLKDEEYFRKSMLKQQNDWQSKFDVYGYSEFNKMFFTQKHRLELLYQYKMREVKHPILLFKAKETMEIFSPIDCYDNNWTKYSNSDLVIIHVDGNHETMFQNNYVKNLSIQLSNLLEKMSISKELEQ